MKTLKITLCAAALLFGTSTNSDVHAMIFLNGVQNIVSGPYQVFKGTGKGLANVSNGVAKGLCNVIKGTGKGVYTTSKGLVVVAGVFLIVYEIVRLTDLATGYENQAKIDGLLANLYECAMEQGPQAWLFVKNSVAAAIECLTPSDETGQKVLGYLSEILTLVSNKWKGLEMSEHLNSFKCDAWNYIHGKNNHG